MFLSEAKRGKIARRGTFETLHASICTKAGFGGSIVIILNARRRNMKKAMVFALVLVCCVSVFAQAQAESDSKTITMWVSGAGAQVDAM